MRIVGVILILLSVPLFVFLLRRYPGRSVYACFFMGFLPFGVTVINVDAALVSWPTWTGYAKGIIYSLTDTLALAIIIAAKHPFRKLPALAVLLAYGCAVIASFLVSNLFTSSSFYFFQLTRLLLVFVAVSHFSGNPKALQYLLAGLACGAFLELFYALDQRLSGTGRAIGTVGHQNLLGLMLHFVSLPLLGMLLAGFRSKLLWAGLLASLVTTALTASRGALLFGTGGLALLIVLSILRNPSGTKLKIAGYGIGVALLAAPIAIESLESRYGEGKVRFEGDQERVAFEAAARSIWSDHPFGVGANQYVVVANSQGYNSRAGVIPTYASRSAKVHNMYLLAAAETGWLGLITFTCLFVWPIWIGLRFAFQKRKDPRGDIVLGATVAIATTAVHGFYEWVFFQVNAQYMYAISLGIIASMIKARRSRPVALKTPNPATVAPVRAPASADARQASV